jgi:glutathione-regulated potassium-efflux system protein KefB
VFALRWVTPDQPEPDMDGVESVEQAQGLKSCVLIIGFGRFGQIASQSLLARGIKITIIENDTEMIRAAARFGFNVYYGDGTRLEVLRASGAENARAVLVCIDNKAAISQIVRMIKREFPLSPVLARAYDRQHAIDLIKLGVDYQLRETFESALAFSGAALKHLGIPDEEVAEVADSVRRRDAERLQLQMSGDMQQVIAQFQSSRWTPTPLTQPHRAGKALNEEAAEAMAPDQPDQSDAPAGAAGDAKTG